MNKDGKFVDVGFNGEGHNSISYKIPKIYRTGYSSNKGGIGYLDPLWKRRYGRIPDAYIRYCLIRIGFRHER